MFRKMRRSPQALSHEEMIDLLKKETRGVMSVQVSYCVFGQEYQVEGDWAKYVKSVIVFGKAELIEEQDEVIRISRLLCDKFPCPQEYVEKEVSKDAPRTLVMAIDIEDMNGKLVHEA